MRLQPAKRAIDIGASALGLIATAPIVAAVAAAIRLRMGPPVLLRQQRAGREGRPFNMPKFRTMTNGPGTDAERLTSLGRRLRRWSLDELPQLWSVLVGDMSLVGPRPLLVQYLGRYTPEQARRHEVKPGITGWAQINGRNALTWGEKFALDVWYVDHASFRLDIEILLRTAARALKGSGISGPDHATAPEFRPEPGAAGEGARQ